jgi:hypothetical protein
MVISRSGLFSGDHGGDSPGDFIILGQANSNKEGSAEV